MEKAYRLEHDPRALSATDVPRERRLPDSLADIFEPEIVPMIRAAPGLRPVAVFPEMRRRYPDLLKGIRRTLERRIRHSRALQGSELDKAGLADMRRKA